MARHHRDRIEESLAKDFIHQTMMLSDGIDWLELSDCCLFRLACMLLERSPETFQGSEAPWSDRMPFQNAVRAVFSYEAQNEKELSFEEDSILLVTEEVDKEWLRGKLQHDTKTGLIPMTYIEEVCAFYSDR